MGFKANNVVMTPREKYEKGYATARYNLLAVIALTALNIIMFLTGSESYFLFSATMPYQLVVIGWVMAQEGAASAILVITIIAAALIIAAYLVCFFIGKKHVWGMVVALILFAIDTVWFLFLAISAFDTSLIINFLFQAWVLYYLIMAIVYHFKLKAMPCDTVENVQQQQDQQTENSVFAEQNAFVNQEDGESNNQED